MILFQLIKFRLNQIKWNSYVDQEQGWECAYYSQQWYMVQFNIKFGLVKEGIAHSLRWINCR